MTQTKNYFFCGIGGSGMLPLAMILKAQDHTVAGSDRALDQGLTGPKFDYLRARGIPLFPQDGSGLITADQILVASAAVEDSVPDVQAAKALGVPRISRAALLAEQFNAAETAIGVAGTSGKSTTTGMIAWILHATGRAPTVMNGAVMKNFTGADAPFASSLVGRPDLFVSEVDESDGSIALFSPRIAVLNNIALDHKSMDELRALFGDFLGKAETAVINLDDTEARALAGRTNGALTCSLSESAAVQGKITRLEAFSAQFTVTGPDGQQAEVRLPVPGAHNVSNALGALAAAMAAGVDFQDAAAALEGFAGLRRRFDLVGTAERSGGAIMVIDDFGHNPDKIAATLQTLHGFPGRLLILFQPHGFGPLRLMKEGFIRMFTEHLAEDDILLMPPPVYFGGTTDRRVTHNDIIGGVQAAGRRAEACADRAACGARLLELAAPGDRILIMGARDDSLSTFAASVLTELQSVTAKTTTTGT